MYSVEGKATNINPTVFATIMKGNFLADPRVSYLTSIAGDDVSHNVNFGSTFGYVIDNVVLGFDVGTGITLKPNTEKSQQLKDNFLYQGIIRVDLDEKHRNWLQTYVGKDAVGIGFRANFK